MALSIKRVTSLVAFGMAALNDNFAMAEQVQNPLRLMFNTDVLRTLFAKGDQRMLEAFVDLKITLEEPSESCPDFTNTVFSIVPNEGIEKADYDFDISIKDEGKDYMGFEGKDLRMVGKSMFGEDT